MTENSYIEIESSKEYLREKLRARKKLLDQKLKILEKLKNGERWVD